MGNKTIWEQEPQPILKDYLDYSPSKAATESMFICLEGDPILFGVACEAMGNTFERLGRTGRGSCITFQWQW